MSRGKGRPAKGRIKLTREQKQELWRIIKSTKEEARRILRARVILSWEKNEKAQQVADIVGCHTSTAAKIRNKFEQHGMNALNDLPRCGRPWRFNAVERMGIVATACDPAPKENGLGGWTMDRLREEVVKRGIVEQIGRTTVNEILEENDLKPHRMKMWEHSTDPQFKEKVTEICELYLNPPEGSVVVSIDEKCGMQALERKYPDEPAIPGRIGRREFEYKRHGTQSLIASLNVHTGNVTSRCGETRKATDLIALMEQVAKEYPGVEVHVIWDNLNIHYNGPDKRWDKFNEKHGGRFHFHFTPLHASWVNQIEVYFSILEKKVLRNGSFHSKKELKEAVLSFIKCWNRKLAHPFKWKFRGYPLRMRTELKKAVNE